MNKYGLLPEVYARLKAKAPSPKPAVLTGSQARVARGLLGWTQADLAKKAGVSLAAIQDLENDKPLAERTQLVIRDAFQRHKVELAPQSRPQKA